MPTDLRRIYKKIIDRLKAKNDEDVLKLLLWVAYAKLPLNIIDLEFAISLDLRRECRSVEQIDEHKIKLTSECVRKMAGTILEVVHDKVYFIHQSGKDFIVEDKVFQLLPMLHGNLSPDCYLASICMAYLNFEDWKDVGPEQRTSFVDPSEMLETLYGYAAVNWQEHISSPDDLSDAMLPYFDSLISFELGHTKSWLEWILSGFNGIVEVIYECDYPQLYIAIECNCRWMIDYVMNSDKYAIDEPKIFQALIQSASHSEETFEMLLCAWEKQSFNQELIPDEVVQEVALHGLADTMALLLKRRPEIVITEDLLWAAVANTSDPWEMVDFLLQRNEGIKLTEDLLIAASKHCYATDVIPLLLDYETELRVTEKVLVATAGNRNDSYATRQK